MHIIKGILIVVLLIVGVGAGLTVASHYFPAVKLSNLSSSIPKAPPLIASSLEKVNVGGIAQGIGTIRSKVLGVQTAKTEEASGSTDATPQPKGKSVPKKTFDYARYTYCQGVVQSYESENADTK